MMDLDELIAAERQEPPEADPEEVRANWKRISASAAAGVPLPVDLSPAAIEVTASSKLAALVASTTTKVTVAVALVGGSTVAVVASQSDESASARVETVSRATSRAPEPRPAREAGPGPVPPTPTPGPDVPSEAAAPSVEETVAASVTEDVEASVASVRPRTTTTPRPPRDEPVRRDDFADELALIQSAQRSLRVDDALAALRALQTHRERHPSGSLREDRLALHVLALCAVGRDEEGRAARDAFVEAWPKSIYVDRIREACRDPAAD